MPLKDFNERFQAEVPLEGEYETISGLLHKLAGRIPDVNEEIHYDNLSFTIMKKSQRRIRLVRLRKKDPAPQVAQNEKGGDRSA